MNIYGVLIVASGFLTSGMCEMYIPDWHWAILVIPILTMFYLFHNYGQGLDVWFVNLTLASVTTFRALYLLVANSLYQMYMTLDGGKRPAVNNPAPRVIPNLNAQGYALTTQSVKIDARRNMAIRQWRTLEYYNHDASKLNWTETYWLKEKPKRWKGKNEEFRACMHDWNGSVIQKKDPLRDNSEYVLRSEEELRRAADGRM